MKSPTAPKQSTHGLSQLVVGAAVSVTDMAMTISFAALVFSGELAAGLPRAASTFVLGAGLATIIVGVRTTLHTALAPAQDVAAIVLLATAASIATSGSVDPVASMFAVLAITAIGFGLLALLVDRTNLTSLAQFLPTSVITGFVAGTGWLLFHGGMQVAVNRQLGLAGLADDLVDRARFLLPALLVATIVLLASMNERIPRAVVGLSVLVAIALFYAVVAIGSTLDTVANGGWLIGPFGEIASWRPLTPADIVKADLPPFWESLTSLSAVVVVSIVGMLLNVKSLIASSEQGDLGNEVRSVGYANLLIGPAGGLIAYHGLGDTTLAIKAGVVGRVVPVAVGVVSVVVGLFGAEIIGYVPRFVVGGMLAGLGLILLAEGYRSVRATRSVEAIVSVLILLVVMLVGALEGVAVGMFAATLIFLVRYSTIDPIRTRGTGSEFSSSIERSADADAALAAHADELLVFRLHGYLFFGSFEAMETELLEALATSNLSSVVLDFRHVTGLDDSAASSLRRISDRAEAHGVLILWSDLSPRLARALDAAAGSDETRRYPDIDYALEAAEEHILGLIEDSASSESTGLSGVLEDFLTTVSFADGQQVVAIGDAGRELYIVAEGRCVASIPSAGGDRRRLREFGAGSIIGEVTFRSGGARTADIHAKGAVRLLAIDRDEYEALAAQHPKLAIELSDRMLAVSSHRVTDLSRRLDQELS